MECSGCGAAIAPGEACVRCEVEPAQRQVCGNAHHDCWAGCKDPSACEPLFIQSAS